MHFEVACDLVLRLDGRDVLDASGASILSDISKNGGVGSIMKRSGLTREELAGTIGAINMRAGEMLIDTNGEELSLTVRGREALQALELRRHMLSEQMKNLWEKPWITADGIIIHEDGLVLIKRGNEPFKGMYALPGGIVEYGERVEDCVVREMREETGLETEVMNLVGVYSDPDRDPRGHFITIAFNLKVIGGELRSGDDAMDANLFELEHLPELAADHLKIIKDALRVRGQ
jgi:8-oxo-dGTP diphosphatase